MTVDEMENLLEVLGIEHVGSRGDEVQGYCPAHEERVGRPDRNPSWFINADTGAHICFSCSYKGSVLSLVAMMRGFSSVSDAKDWLNGSGNDFLDLIDKTLAKKKKPVFEELVYISEATLAAFTEPPPYALAGRGISTAVANQYQILWNKRKQSWVTPIRDVATGKLLGWQEKGYSGRYFNNAPTGIKKSSSLFGLEHYNGGTLIVVESPLDVARLATVGVSGGVSTFGALISSRQLEYIRRAEKVLFALDSDEAGLAATDGVLKLTRELGFEAWFFNYSETDAKDVGAMSKDEILNGLNNAHHSVNYGIKL
jgi:DNA primase